MNKDRVSIITAVYKAEEFLDRCVESLVKQEYTNLEILLIDDGSPDNCPQKCDEWAQKDKRIKVIHKQNGGVSSAWNAGLDNAAGEYIAFVDSDDWVESNYVSELYNLIQKHNCDIAICSNDIIREEGIRTQIIDGSCPAEETYYVASNCLKAFFAEKEWRHTAWGKLYKKNIFQSLRYPEDIMCTEDTYMICDICKQVQTGIATTSKVLYHYVMQNKSVSKTINEKRFDWIRSKRHILEQLTSDNQAYPHACKHLYASYVSIYKSFKDFRRKDLIKQLNQWLKEDYKKYAKYIKGKYKICFYLFRYHRPFYNFVMAIKKGVDKVLSH